MRLIVAALLAAAWVTGPTHAQPARPRRRSPTLLAFLTGRWDGTGTILGQPARAELEWTPVLDGRFVAAHLGEPHRRRRRRRSGSRATPTTSATATGGYRATWFDSSGMVRPIDRRASTARPSSPPGARLETELGETTYRRDGRRCGRGGGPRARQERRVARVRPLRRCAACREFARRRRVHYPA